LSFLAPIHTRIECGVELAGGQLDAHSLFRFHFLDFRLGDELRPEIKILVGRQLGVTGDAILRNLADDESRPHELFLVESIEGVLGVPGQGPPHIAEAGVESRAVCLELGRVGDERLQHALDHHVVGRVLERLRIEAKVVRRCKRDENTAHARLRLASVIRLLGSETARGKRQNHRRA
jgi:hypothetical protein